MTRFKYVKSAKGQKLTKKMIRSKESDSSNILIFNALYDVALNNPSEIKQEPEKMETRKRTRTIINQTSTTNSRTSRTIIEN